jgi:hypothetical protein
MVALLSCNWASVVSKQGGRKMNHIYHHPQTTRKQTTDNIWAVHLVRLLLQYFGFFRWDLGIFRRSHRVAHKGALQVLEGHHDAVEVREQVKLLPFLWTGLLWPLAKGGLG